MRRLSKIDVSTFKYRCIALRRSMCRPSKIDVSTFGDRCVDFRRSMCRPSEMDVLTEIPRLEHARASGALCGYGRRGEPGGPPPSPRRRASVRPPGRPRVLQRHRPGAHRTHRRPRSRGGVGRRRAAAARRRRRDRAAQVQVGTCFGHKMRVIRPLAADDVAWAFSQVAWADHDGVVARELHQIDDDAGRGRGRPPSRRRGCRESRSGEDRREDRRAARRAHLPRRLPPRAPTPHAGRLHDDGRCGRPQCRDAGAPAGLLLALLLLPVPGGAGQEGAGGLGVGAGGARARPRPGVVEPAHVHQQNGARVGGRHRRGGRERGRRGGWIPVQGRPPLAHGLSRARGSGHRRPEPAALRRSRRLS